MRLHDTLSGSVREVGEAEPLGVYVCGVTPYDTTHLGHARTYLVFDVIVRWLAAQGRQARYVQNVTDVDDSILQRAAALGEPYDALGHRYTRIYLEDMAALGALPADRYPTASGAVPEIVEAVGSLLDSGHAYRVDGDVYFRITRAAGYGRLSRLERDRMLELTAEQDDADLDDPRKEDPLDFALWRASGAGEPAWESPWGPGRPGWHIECTVLALSHLGAGFEIHGGGEDLVYPHHECELAQAAALKSGEPFARLWVHVGMVRLDGKKMSKSLGNMVFVRDVLEEHSPDALRLYLLGVPYREPFDHDPGRLAEAAGLAERLEEAAGALPVVDGRREVDPEPARRRFTEALDGDLDTPGAMAVLAELAVSIQGAVQEGRAAGRAQRALLEMGGVLGLGLGRP